MTTKVTASTPNSAERYSGRLIRKVAIHGECLTPGESVDVATAPLGDRGVALR